MNSYTKVKVFLSVGSTILVLSVIFASCFEMIFNKILHNALIIDEGSPIFEQFKTPSAPVYLDFYFFNVTNPEEIKNYGAKPILQEVGPYSYNELYNKSNIAFDRASGTVSYNQNATFFYNRERSVGPETDQITTLNAVMVTLGEKIDSLSPGLRAIGELLFLRFNLNNNLFVTRSVSELLFTGYYDPFIELLGQIAGDPTHADGKFGFFYPLNGTSDGLYTVNTGARGMDEYLSIKKWRNSSSLDFWNDEHCDTINGTDGSQFAPGVSKDKPIYLYASDLCRSIYITFEQEKLIHKTRLYRFTLPRKALAITETKCFCQDEFTCQDSMVNIKACRDGAPVVLSTPHFYQSDGTELAKLEGLSPTKELHETFLDIEPTSGIMMSMSKRLQFNLPLRKYGNLPSFRNVPEVIFPIFWADENAIISKEEAEEFNKVLTLPFTIVYSVCDILILVGLILAFTGLVMYKNVKIEPKFELIVKR